MPKSRKRKNSKLHCQKCAQQRTMMQFFAINTEQKDGKNNVYPFKVRKFLELIQGKENILLPRYYCGICSTCGEKTFYQGENHSTKLQVIAI